MVRLFVLLGFFLSVFHYSQAQTYILYTYTGETTTSSAKVGVKIDDQSAGVSSYAVRLYVDTKSDFSGSPFYFPSTAVSVDNATNYEHTFDVTGLSANTHYYYRVEIDGALDTRSAKTRGEIYTLVSDIASTTNGDVQYVWSGGVTENSAKVTTKIFDNTGTNSYSLKLVADDDPAFGSPVFSSAYTADNSSNYHATMQITGLSSNTQYYYRVEVDGVIDTDTDVTGKFKTFDTGAFSFKIALASCDKSKTSSSADQIYQSIYNENPLLFISTGDLHYGDMTTAAGECGKCNCQDCGTTEKNECYSACCPLNYEYEYQNIFLASGRKDFYKDFPLAYVWDDHDFTSNNSFSTAFCKSEAIWAYKNYFPSYDLAFTGTDDVISQSFVVGRVKFVMTDLRSDKIAPKYSNNTNCKNATFPCPDGVGGDCELTTVGDNFGSAAHLNWFKNELLDAKNNNQFVVWVSGIPFNGKRGIAECPCNENDEWGGYEAQRTEIADFVKNNNINICVVAGDAHMTAIDDGTNSDFATGGGAEIPVFQAGPIYQKGSWKGGLYSHGRTVGGDDDISTAYSGVNKVSSYLSQYGILEITDNGGSDIQIDFIGKNSDGSIITNMPGDQKIVNSDSAAGGFEVDGTELRYSFTATLTPTLPVEMLSFDLKKQGKSASVSWQTSSEKNSDFFVVERSKDGQNFEALKKIQAQGNSSSLKIYETLDSKPFLGLSYYRLKIQDQDGNSEYSVIKSIYFDALNVPFSVYPNPSDENTILTLNIDQNVLSEISFQLIDMQGKTVWEKKNLEKNQFQLPSLTKGVYILKASTKTETYQQKIVV